MNTQTDDEHNDRVWKGKVTEQLHGITKQLDVIRDAFRVHVIAFDQCRERCRNADDVAKSRLSGIDKEVEGMQRSMTNMFRFVIGVAIVIVAAGVVHSILIK